MNWPQLEEILLDCTHPNFQKSELEYLRKAYEEIEKIWKKRRDDLSRIDYIILGEAPLFGNHKKYIYAQNGLPSVFLRPSDFPNYDKAKSGSDKKALWTLLASNHMIVVDLFPYALNKIDTPSLSYSEIQRGKYPGLYHQVFRNFTALKLAEIKNKNPNVSVLVRYKRLISKVGPILEELGFSEGAKRGGYVAINSNNMWVNKDVFSKFCSA